MSTYTDNGYESRRDYLESIAADYGVPMQVVFEVASMLGPDEDFDGLITTLSDYLDQC